MTPSWPAYEKGELVLANPESGVGVCCLWTDRRRLAATLDPRLYAALGNLYSSGGISTLVRNVLANTGLRYLVVCGVDLTGSGSTLVALFEHGLDLEHRIATTSIAFDPLVPATAIESLRERVGLVDLRGVADPARINSVLESVPSLPPSGEPLQFPEANPRLETLPSEGILFVVRHGTVARAWLESLKLAMQFGTSALNEVGQSVHELVNLAAVLTEPADRLFVPSWLPVDRQTAEDDAEALWQGRSADSRRSRRSGGWGQFSAMVERLKVASETRRALAVTWNRDVDVDRQAAPNLCMLSALISHGDLALTATFRSQELGRGWPRTALALRLAQARLATETGAACGPLTLIAYSAQVDRDDAELQGILEQHQPRLLLWRPDPRGIFLIRLADGQIVVEHGVQDRGRSGRTFTGASAERLYKAIVHEQLVSLAEHAAYLGAELQKAEMALRLGLTYRQDEPLELPGHG